MAVFKKRELILSVKCKSFRQDDFESDSSDIEFKKVRPHILERDDHTCQYCGFRCAVDNGRGSGSYMEVHHLDDDHNNNDKKNLVTICQFCHNCQHIGFAGSNGEAMLIWLPELEQWELHHMVRACMIAGGFKRNIDIENNSRMGRNPAAQNMSIIYTEMYETSEMLMNELKNRAGIVKEKIGTSSAQVLGNVLEVMDEKDYNRRKEFLNGIRLLPLGKRRADGCENVYEEKIIPVWMQSGGPYISLPPTTWKTFANRLNRG